MLAFRAATMDVMAPAVGVLTQPIEDAAGFVRNASGIASLQSENIRLTEENARLREWYQTAQLLDAENKSLLELLNVKVDPENRYVTARILGDSGNTFVRSLLLSAGKKDGVAKDQAVLSGVGLVGRIVESGQNASRVLLINDINSRVPVIVEDSRQHAIMAGDNDGKLTLLHMPPDTQLSIGARIVTSGQGGIFPAGVAVGRVVAEKTGGYRIEPFADFNRLTVVRIVNRPTDPNLKESGPHDLD